MAASRQDPSFVVDIAERVGVPSALLAALLYGAFLLLQPVSLAIVENITEQTQLLKEIASDMQRTRQIVEADRDERKADMIRELNTKVDDLRKIYEQNNESNYR